MAIDQAIQDLAQVIKKITTEADARGIRAAIVVHRDAWVERYGADNDVARYFDEALAQVNEIIRCHGHC